MVYEDEDFPNDASFASEKEKKPLKSSKKPNNPRKSVTNAIKEEFQCHSRDGARQKLRNYLFSGAYREMETYMMENVATLKVPHPWLTTPRSKKRLRRALDRCINLYLRNAFSKVNAVDLEIPEKYQEAAASISQLNEELISSILVVGNFSKEVDMCAQSTCVRYIIIPGNTSSEMEGTGLETVCTVDGCQKRQTKPRHIILEDAKYGENLEFDGSTTGRHQMITLCREHSVFFELMCDLRHMVWNIYNNCLTMVRQHNKQASAEEISFDAFLAWLPASFQARLIASYMARYHMFWAFGSSDDWLSRGYTINQLLSK